MIVIIYRFFLGLVYLEHKFELIFFIVEMDSTPSRTLMAPKSLEFCLGVVYLEENFELFFFMVEMDSTPSKTLGAPKILMFYNYSLDFKTFYHIFS